MRNLKQTLKVFFTITLVSLTIMSCEFPDAVPSSYYDEPVNIIPIQQAKEMYDEYSKNKVPALKEFGQKDGAEFNPTRYIEYSIEDLRHYLTYIENESKRADVDINSIRIYLGAYPNSEAFKTEGRIEYPKQESIFITPTAIFDGEELAYFTRGDMNGGKRYAVPTKGLGEELMKIKGFNNRKFEKASMLPFIQVKDTTDDRSLTMNRGNVKPPPKKDDDFSGGNGEN